VDHMKFKRIPTKINAQNTMLTAGNQFIPEVVPTSGVGELCSSFSWLLTG
jgi:hypothetical protein